MINYKKKFRPGSGGALGRQRQVDLCEISDGIKSVHHHSPAGVCSFYLKDDGVLLSLVTEPIKLDYTLLSSAVCQEGQAHWNNRQDDPKEKGHISEDENATAPSIMKQNMVIFMLKS